MDSLQTLHEDNSHLSTKSFEVIKYLAEGGFGKVFQVRKKYGKNKNKVYAMKVIHKKHVLVSPILTKYALAEVNTLKYLRHPFIIKLAYAFQSKSNLYAVLEYAEGGTLGKILEEQYRLLECDAAFYMKELILGIEYMHSQNVIHRDIKPDNILIDSNGHVKLADFGLCKENFHGVAFTKCGTLLFQAPELLKGGYGKEVDWWALGVTFYKMVIGRYPFTDNRRKAIAQKRMAVDWWALGVMLYKMVFGEYPVTGNHTKVIAQKIMTGCYNCPSDLLSSEAEDLIRGLLDINPDKRLDVEKIKNHDFFEGTSWSHVSNCLEIPPFVPKIVSVGQKHKEENIQNLTSFDLSKKISCNLGNTDVFNGFNYDGDSKEEQIMSIVFDSILQLTKIYELLDINPDKRLDCEIKMPPVVSKIVSVDQKHKEENIQSLTSFDLSKKILCNLGNTDAFNGFNDGDSKEEQSTSMVFESILELIIMFFTSNL